MRISLLNIVQKVLESMDSEDVNSISDTVESQQVASMCEDVYNQFIVEKNVPEHKGLVELTALSDTNFPTHFKYGTNVRQFETIYYNQSEVTGETEWREVKYLEPLEYLMITDNQNGSHMLVEDKNGGTKLSIGTDKYPSYYTSFDNEHIVMDSYKSTVDNSLQQGKSRAYGWKYPTFNLTDSFIPDLDETLSVLYLTECKLMCMSLLKKEVNPKLEQTSRRLRAHTQGDRYKTKKGYKPHGYGR